MNDQPKHPDVEELAALYVAGGLSPEQAQDVERRLASGDSAMRKAIAELDSAAQALLELTPETNVPPRIKERLLAEIAASEPSVADSETSESAGSGPELGSAKNGPNPQVWKQWSGDQASDPMFLVRGGEQSWEPTGIDGVETRRLFVDRERDQTTMLVRMAPGTSYPRHRHGGPEECFVLEGDLRVGEEVMHAGDYQRAAAGSHHPVQSTTKGCLLFLVSSLSDELA